MASDQIVYKAGHMQHFKAARAFALGSTGMNVPKGADLLFDGTKVDFGGSEFQQPQLRGAIKAGRMVLEARYDEDDTTAEQPQSANIQVRHPTQGGNPMMGGTRPVMSSMTATETDEREVGNTRTHAQATQARNTQKPGTPIRNGVGSSVEMQDGIPVRKLKTASGQKAKDARTVLTSESAGTALREANSVTIDPGQGITEDEMLDRMDPAAADEYLAKKNSKKAQYVDVAEQAPRVVGRVATRTTQSSEGMTAKMSVGGGLETFDGAGTGAKVETRVIESEGLKFTQTNGAKRDDSQQSSRAAGSPAPVLKESTMDVRRQVAKAMCQDFPDNYDFTTTPRKKLARLQADFEDRPDVIRAVFAAEGDDFKGTLIQEFPQAFSG